MTLFQKASLLLLAASAPMSFAAEIPTSLNDNVVTCTPAAGCTNKTMFGRNYKVIRTPRFDVMVSLSTEGAYTRADVSVSNHLGYPQQLSPQDFRVEVVTPKPHVLAYIPPTDLQNVPPAPPAPTPNPPAPPAATTGSPTTPNIDELYAQAKKEAALKEAAERAAAEQHLPAAPIQPNDTIRGRVYFERDDKAKAVNVVIPIAGVVFEFPYTLK